MLNQLRLFRLTPFALTVAGVAILSWPVIAQAPTRPFAKPLLTYPTPMDPDDIAGVVTSLEGPEPGVWVIARSEAQASLVRIVLTNEEGRYLLPDLPRGSYQVFVRGYGLEDSKPSKAWPGQQLFFGVTRSSTFDRSKIRPAGADRNLVVTLWDENAAPNLPTVPADSRPSAAPTCTIPYPTEFASNTLEERIDDRAEGWKGSGFWGRSDGKVFRCQQRPNPLAR